MNGIRKAAWIALFLSLGMATPAEATDLSGTWAGSWNSFSTGHNGPLRCTLQKMDETSYRADFSGRFFKLIPFSYSVTLGIDEDGEVVTLSGKNYLGRLFGTFSYSAEVDEGSFTASYKSCRDCGQFVMRRCCSFARAKQ